ncbi:MAG: helix-turn-helix domain-containing protein [Rhodopila sp.]
MDIDAMADYFSQKYARENRLPDPVLTARTRSCLMEHGWPGNVRELANVMHRAVILAGGGLIDDNVIDFPQGRNGAGPAGTTGQPGDADGFVARSLDQAERSLILSTLEHTGGNRTQAAKILEISIRALRNKPRDYAAAGVAVPAPASGLQPRGRAAAREAVATAPD